MREHSGGNNWSFSSKNLDRGQGVFSLVLLCAAELFSKDTLFTGPLEILASDAEGREEWRLSNLLLGWNAFMFVFFFRKNMYTSQESLNPA